MEDNTIKRLEAKYTKQSISKALDLINKYGGYDGAHHKQWLLNELVEVLSDDYEKWVEDYEAGEHGPKTYVWDKGIAP